MKFPNRSLIILSFILLIIACDDKEEFNNDPKFRLNFSLDSLTFDTIFSGIPSITKQLKVYNRSSKAIYIDNIELVNDDETYQLNINGLVGNKAKQVYIPAKDSLYIFIELSVQDKNQDSPRLIEDYIQFQFNSRVQKFLLKSWAQDVIRFKNNELQTQGWTRNRPYFIDENLFLGKTQNLTIEAGTKVYFQKGAGLHISGNLNIQGSFEEPVFFGSHRREELYDNVPGQWEGLFFYSESKANFISHLQLENAIKGISAQSEINDNNLEIEYSQFLNFTTTGIKSENFNLKMHDVIISNCGKQTVFLEGEGNFEFSHCNFINYWQLSSRTDASFCYLANENSGKELKLYNSIIWGTKSDEIELCQTGGIEIKNTLIRLSQEKQNNFSNILENCIFNTDPEFMNKNEHNYNIRSNSPLINKAKLNIANFYPLDFNGNSRLFDTAPDIGSFEYIEVNE
ncbi:hypothetical protein DWB61_04535 [Ancylomarina euxinus]|uniref:Right-handed parallel beta-helix repeat-containing protein n=1 Tax=Ancylomarina euxinus TaxID=2283627 RepID=A0A425Y584_9BACT|nr:hypothetical protein [Ancylomarina euxinus]MCZ4694318.1 hypothetical protein [Ancylomarina euxinus]MUP14351.1 hypothetical protein [Ancylomarina euxinus]RRG23663.1 hypothetical protein DWB61_04535 [Ancylomarina euxinus]